MNKILILMMSLCACIMAQADDKLVYEMVKQYANLTSCNHSFEDNAQKRTTLSDVIFVKNDDYATEYYVLWHGNMGCTTDKDGSMKSHANITIVAKPKVTSNKYYINDWNPFSEIADFNQYYIESLSKIGQDKYRVISWDWADEKYGGRRDGQVANKFEYIIEFVTDELDPSIGSYEITNQRLLEQRK